MLNVKDLPTREQLFWLFKMTTVALTIQVAIARGDYAPRQAQS